MLFVPSCTYNERSCVPNITVASKNLSTRKPLVAACAAATKEGDDGCARALDQGHLQGDNTEKIDSSAPPVK